MSFSPYLDTDPNEFFQYMEVNFSPMGHYSINGEKQNISVINRQEHHQNVRKLQSKYAFLKKMFHHYNLASISEGETLTCTDNQGIGNGTGPKNVACDDYDKSICTQEYIMGPVMYKIHFMERSLKHS